MNVDSILLVAYISAPMAKSAVQVWQDEVGAFPQSFQQMPIGGSLCAGTIGEHSFILHIQPNRVDVTIQPGESSISHTAPAVANPDEALKDAQRLLMRAIDEASLVRPASVWQSSRPTRDIAETIAEVGKLVPGIQIPARANDVSFQLNVPSPSASVDGHNIVRSMRVFSGRKAAMQVTEAGGVSMITGSFGVAQNVDVFIEEGAVLRDVDVFEKALVEILEAAKHLTTDGIGALLV